MQAVGSTGESLQRTEVAEVVWDTRPGDVGIWVGDGADRTRFLEAHCSEIVEERAGTGARTKGVARGESTGHGLGVGKKCG